MFDDRSFSSVSFDARSWLGIGSEPEPVVDQAVSGWGGMLRKPRPDWYSQPKQTADELLAERIKLGIIEPVVKKQHVAEIQHVAEKQQVVAKKQQSVYSSDKYWELHAYEQLLLLEEAKRQAAEAIAEAQRKAEEADIAFLLIAMAAMD